MKIILKINNEDKTYIAPFVSARKLKETLRLSDKIQSGLTESIIDELTEFEVSLYANQFTIDELLDGYPSEEFLTKILSDLEEVIGGFNSSIKK